MADDDPFVTAAMHVLELALKEMRGCIEGAPTEALNWCPSERDTNSIAVLTVHALASTRSWLSVAVGAPLPARARDAEFETKSRDATTLSAYIDLTGGECRALLADAGVIDWRATRHTHPRPRADAPETVSGAWALLHAIEHLREHEGQMFLTRQLWDLRNHHE